MYRHRSATSLFSLSWSTRCTALSSLSFQILRPAAVPNHHTGSFRQCPSELPVDIRSRLLYNLAVLLIFSQTQLYNIRRLLHRGRRLFFHMFNAAKEISRAVTGLGVAALGASAPSLRASQSGHQHCLDPGRGVRRHKGGVAAWNEGAALPVYV